MKTASGEAVWITGVGSLTNLGLGFESLLEAHKNPISAFSPVPQDWLQHTHAPHTFIAKLSSAAQEELLKPKPSRWTGRLPWRSWLRLKLGSQQAVRRKK